MQKAKLVERAERLVEADKKREDKMKAEKLKLEAVIWQMQRDAERQLAPLRMVELLQEENASLKKTIDWQQEKIDAIKKNALQAKNV